MENSVTVNAGVCYWLNMVIIPKYHRGNEKMREKPTMRGLVGEISAITSIIALVVIVAIVFTAIYVEDMYQKLTIGATAALVFTALLSAKAAKDSAKSASIAHEQAIYAHLADIWYKIKLKEFENSDFIDPQFTSLYRSKDVYGKYHKYHVHAWLCWGHAEDCYNRDLHKDSAFNPSIGSYKEFHYAWFCVPKNRHLFDPDFVKWVVKKLKPYSVAVKSQGTLHGNGVFAEEEFRKDDFIGFFEGEEVDDRTNISLQFAPNFHVKPSSTTPFRNLNHSCAANAFFRGRNLYARKQIDKGQEITIDYNCSEFELAYPFQCDCRTKDCVGRIQEIRGYKSLSQDERRRRAEWVPDWLKEMGNTTSAAHSS